jgi:uncharacterized SAM-binding protein YcdF (DUF218 family)
MFFALSKILFFIIQPLSWLVGMLGWALFTKNSKIRLKLLRGVFWLLVILTNPLIFNVIAKNWEHPPTPMHDLRDTFDIAVVLGGFSNGDDISFDNRLHFNTASNRLTDALVLYKKGIVKKILISGGDGKLLGKKSPEALATEPFVLAMGVPQEDILLEANSRNTYENALFTKQLLENQPIKPQKILLVTSAFHIYRSVRCFKKVGLEVTPFAAHFESETFEWQPKKWLIPNSKNIMRWESFIKEWVGCVVYKLQGYN